MENGHSVATRSEFATPITVEVDVWIDHPDILIRGVLNWGAVLESPNYPTPSTYSFVIVRRLRQIA